jgi:osmotically-inducible protein OsmY
MLTEMHIAADNHLREAVLRELGGDSELTSKDVTASVKEGIVTLTGFVHNTLEKSAAERAAKRVEGIIGVANDIEVKLGRERTDPEIVRDAVQALRAHPSVPAERITITVRDAEVTLEGTANWQYQRMAAEAAVKRVRGIAAIHNRIEIEAKTSPDQLRTSVEKALRGNPSLCTLPLRVIVDDNTASLYGTTRLTGQKQEAERTAALVPGIARVENHITEFTYSAMRV